jgi:solute carrier family 25 thiamine pyrophosphate transporter 19
MGKQNKLIDDIFAGAFAGCVARMMTAPFDVIKIRFQLQNNADKKYTSVLQSLRSIIKEEGFFSLWKGNVSALYLWVSYSMIQFAAYDVLKNIGETVLNPFERSRDDTDANKPHIQSSSSKSQWSAFKRSIVLFVAGAGAGMIATTTTYPFDITRTQFALQVPDIICALHN